jgi:alpha-ribazole phosphatase
VNLYLVRHTVPDIQPGICYGQTDIELAETYAHEVEVVKTKLSEVTPVAVYSSPLKRCKRLAAEIASHNNCHVQHDTRLMELHFGNWEKMAWNDIPRGLVDVWADDLVMQAPPSGESFHALSLRVQDFFQELSASPNYSGKDVIALTHAGVIRAMLSHALNMPLTDSFRFQIDYGSVTLITMGKALPRVIYVNR